MPPGGIEQKVGRGRQEEWCDRENFQIPCLAAAYELRRIYARIPLFKHLVRAKPTGHEPSSPRGMYIMKPRIRHDKESLRWKNLIRASTYNESTKSIQLYISHSHYPSLLESKTIQRLFRDRREIRCIEEHLRRGGRLRPSARSWNTDDGVRTRQLRDVTYYRSCISRPFRSDWRIACVHGYCWQEGQRAYNTRHQLS